MLCPKCSTDRAHRAHRRGLKDHLISLFGSYPYRCHECGHRFFRLYRRTGDPDHPSSHAREVREARLTQSAKRKRRELLLYGVALLVFLAFLYYISRYHGSPAAG